MSVTLTSNYQEMLSDVDLLIVNSIVEEQELPLEYVLECYDYFGDEYADELANIVETLENVGCNKDDLMDFIESYGVENLEYLEEYLDLLDEYDDDAIDAFISIYDVSDLNQFVDRYEGYYSTVSEFVENILESMGTEIPSWVAVDYEATWNASLRFDYDEHEGQYFRSC